MEEAGWVGFCGSCAPVEGTHGVTDTAAVRYAFCYSTPYGDWLRAWLNDQVDPIDVTDRERVFAQWESDRVTATAR